MSSVPHQPQRHHTELQLRGWHVPVGTRLRDMHQTVREHLPGRIPAGVRLRVRHQLDGRSVRTGITPEFQNRPISSRYSFRVFFVFFVFTSLSSSNCLNARPIVVTKKQKRAPHADHTTSTHICPIDRNRTGVCVCLRCIRDEPYQPQWCLNHTSQNRQIKRSFCVMHYASTVE